MTDPTLRASASLSAARIIHGDDFQLRVTITNVSPRPVQLNALFLRFATLALRIERADGSFVEPGPPPLPPRDDGKTARILLAPGASHEREYLGGNYSPQRLPPGEYRPEAPGILSQGGTLSRRARARTCGGSLEHRRTPRLLLRLWTNEELVPD